ncbi:hypothetical protein NPIL_328331 [Nephila pilipes]|uniref:Uncharacterized protein n=1 Tax=Nephila pilipes TaxID=299642 RepID=A0A8X6NWC4_NEPPI|nr:hypothetical protein NPIL_328331 [Nephila pilipes]
MASGPAGGLRTEAKRRRQYGQYGVFASHAYRLRKKREDTLRANRSNVYIGLPDLVTASLRFDLISIAISGSGAKWRREG